MRWSNRIFLSKAIEYVSLWLNDQSVTNAPINITIIKLNFLIAKRTSETSSRIEHKSDLKTENGDC